MAAAEGRRGLSVRISHADCSPVQQTQYVIRVTDLHTDSYERTVRRPYSEFRRLRSHLLNLLKHDEEQDAQRISKDMEELFFPPKKLFGSRSEQVVRMRAKTLNKWITRILAIITEFRKAQKSQAMRDPTASTQCSAKLLDALRTFLTSRVEELNVVTREKTRSMPVSVPNNADGVSAGTFRQLSASCPEDNQEEERQAAVEPAPAWNEDVAPKTSSRSILKSQDRPKPSTTRKTKTRFSIAEPVESFSNNHHSNHSNSSTSSSEETHRSSSSSTAPSSASGSFVSSRTTRNKSNATSRASLSKTEMSTSSTTSRRYTGQGGHRSSLVKDARYSMTRPKVVKRLPAGDETEIVQQAEQELESLGLSNDAAQMLLRYMDRFLVKATQRQPGCYRITPDNWLAIDAERLCSELEEALFDPVSMQNVLHNGVEWRIPTALEGYIQHKWAVHHNRAMDEMDHDDDSDEEIAVEFLTRSARKTLPRFSRHDIDEIEQMMSEGNASRSQVKQLRRQLDEGSWDRHGRVQTKPTDEDDDEDSLGEEEDIDFETYARRKSQKSTRFSTFNYDAGGLV